MLIVYAAAAVALGIVLAALRNPLIRRIGIRNAVRRPREAALVMLGCVLGTALIVGNASVGDSFTSSIKRQALNSLGTLDAVVTYENATNWADASAQFSALRNREIATTTPVAFVTTPVTKLGGTTTAPRTNLIEANYARAGSLVITPGERPGTGPAPGTAWIASTLAARLDLSVGNTITIHTKTPTRLRVTKIVANGLVSFLDGDIRAGEGVLVPVGTVAKLQAQDPVRVLPQYLTLVVATTPHDNSAPDAARLAALRRLLTRTVTPFSGEVTMVRADAIRIALAEGASRGTFLTTIGAFGIIAGILLLVNVLLMLAEERLAEMGTMRAVGMSRGPLIGSFSLEGAAYALVGSFVGGAVGVALGRFLVFLMDDRAGSEDFSEWGSLDLRFFVARPTVVRGIAAGFLVSVIAVIATSYRVSRLDVIRSLRGLPDQTRRRRGAATPLLVLGVFVGAGLAAIGLSAPKGMLLLAGGVVACLSFGGLFGRRYGADAGTIAGTAPLVVFMLAFHMINQEPPTGPNLAVLSGVVAVTAGVFLMNALQARFAALLRRIGRGRAAVPTRLGLANPISHRVRTLLTVGPFALVIFTLAYAEGLQHLAITEVRGTAPTMHGSYTLFADSSAVAPFDFTKFDHPDLRLVAPVGTTFGSFSFDPDKRSKVWPITGFDDRFLDVATPPPLAERGAQYATDRAAYEAVLADPDLIIVTSAFLRSGGIGPPLPDDPDRPAIVGDSYTMFNPATNQARDVTVVGIRQEDIFAQGPFYGAEGMTAMFGPRFAMTDAYMVTDGEGAAVIERLQRTGVGSGVRVRNVEDAATAAFASLNSIVNLFRSDLGIGIVVGVAGIGVVLVRSVRDRRRQIGTLRAMGFEASEIRTSFLVEGAFIATQSLAVGMGIGVVMISVMTKSEIINTLIGFHPNLRLPPPTIAYITIGLFFAALAACALPARSAAKIPPAVALRLVD